MSGKPLQIWFEFASTYSYLTVMRAEPMLREAGVDFVWRPFLLGPVFAAKGLTNSPFVLDPIKGDYMLRDLERRCEQFSLPFRRPSRFPAKSLRAARLMTAVLDEPWCGDFARAVFTAQFGRDADIGSNTVLAEALAACGADADHWLARSLEPAIKLALRERTEEAQALGIFGAPSFIVDGELFWGDDRLEDAIRWAKDQE